MEGDRSCFIAWSGICISIHSLRMEGDLQFFRCHTLQRHFNPLPPHGGRRLCGSSLDSCSRLFQSTPSAWRETLSWMYLLIFRFISIHSLRMEGDDSLPGFIILVSVISIHSLRMEGDKKRQCNGKQHSHFNPLPPHGGRPRRRIFPDSPQRISIHSLRMEGDHPRMRLRRMP